jgi:hypothetical protein
VRSIVSVLVLLAACDTRQAMEPRLRFELTRSEAHIDEAERIAAAGGDPTFPCTAVRQMIAGLADERVHTVNDTVERGRRVCREVTLGFASTLVARLETRGRLDVAQRRARDCVDLSRSLALVNAIAKDDPQATALEKRRKTLCP